jgi:hypothetical protein
VRGLRLAQRALHRRQRTLHDGLVDVVRLRRRLQLGQHLVRALLLAHAVPELRRHNLDVLGVLADVELQQAERQVKVRLGHLRLHHPAALGQPGGQRLPLRRVAGRRRRLQLALQRGGRSILRFELAGDLKNG